MKILSYIAGGKGGTGKSIFAIALINYILKILSAFNVHVIDTDGDNPDVARIFKNFPHTTGTTMALQVEDDWMQLLSAIDQNTSEQIVVNTPAGLMLWLQTMGAERLAYVIDYDQINFLTFWVMSEDDDCILLLKNYMKIFPTAMIFPVINRNFASKIDNFSAYNNDQVLKDEISKRGGFPITLPKISEFLALKMKNGYHPDKLKLEFGPRCEWDLFQKKIRDQLDQIFRPEQQE